MEKAAAHRFGLTLTEPTLFVIKAGTCLIATAVMLYVLLASGYPAVHDALHGFRHALAIVPCH
ncbi:MAG TPA: CbtB-domain containing protein [Candidatus Eisenbacteria bacterium]|nr:CbtB-domain containing protein [Candidatus Eisenbacteria bacterium]